MPDRKTLYQRIALGLFVSGLTILFHTAVVIDGNNNGYHVRSTYMPQLSVVMAVLSIGMILGGIILIYRSNFHWNKPKSMKLASGAAGFILALYLTPALFIFYDYNCGKVLYCLNP